MKGHMVTGTRGGHQVTRHASFFKKFEGKVDKKPIEDDVSEDQDEGASCDLAFQTSHYINYAQTLYTNSKKRWELM